MAYITTHMSIHLATFLTSLFFRVIFWIVVKVFSNSSDVSRVAISNQSEGFMCFALAHFKIHLLFPGSAFGYIRIPAGVHEQGGTFGSESRTMNSWAQN